MIGENVFSDPFIDPTYEDITDIYYDIESEISFSFTMKELFSHFISSIHRLLAPIRYQYGISARNLPRKHVEELASLYRHAFYEIYRNTKKSLSLEKYNYDTNYQDFLSSSVSMYDYIKRTTGLPPLDDNPKTRKIRHIYEKYLPYFFGIKYDETLKKPVLYEVIRLVKILDNCSCSFTHGNFLYLLSPSIVKFNTQTQTIYSETIKTIKYDLMIRSCCIGTTAYIKNIIAMEVYVDALKSFLDSFPDKIMSRIKALIGKRCTCLVEREIYLQIYKIVIKSSASSSFKQYTAYNHLEDPSAIANYAYLHFLLSGVKGYFPPPGRKEKLTKVYYPEASHSFYDNLHNFPAKDYIGSEEAFYSFVKNYEHEIVDFIHMDNFVANDRKKHLNALRNRIEKYKILFVFFKKFLAKDDPKATDIVLIIKFYDTVFQSNEKIPLYSGYTSTNKRALTIHHLLKRFDQQADTKKSGLSDEEYTIACWWLKDRMEAFWEMRTSLIQLQIYKMRIAILEVWKKIFPL